MAEVVLGGVRAGSSPLYEVAQDDEFPHDVVIRSVEDPSNRIKLTRGAVPSLIGVLRDVAQHGEEVGRVER